MAGVAGKRPKVVLVKKDAVDQAGTFLEALPEKPREDFSLRAAVDRLHEPIKAALAKGYSYEEVAGLLAKQGITISASTLKNYAPSGTRQSKNSDSTSTKERKTRKAGESTADTQSSQSTELAVQSEPAPDPKPQSNVIPLVAKTETPKATTAKSTTPKTRTTAAKTASNAKATAAKTKPVDSKPTTATKTTKKPATTSDRSKTTKKK